MEDTRFDRLTRSLSGTATRRDTLAGLAGGLLLPLLLPEPLSAKDRQPDHGAHGETWRHRKCPRGLTRCTYRKGSRKKRRCVDLQTDITNCGACGNACPVDHLCLGGVCTGNAPVCTGCRAGSACEPGTSVEQCGVNGATCQACPGDDCNAPLCAEGACSTTPTSGKSCNGDTGICDDSGKCQPLVCAGKRSASPCFPRDASTCNTSGSTCRCGTDINGINHCYENAYCNNAPGPECTSNEDCVAIIGHPGAICFLADGCCLSRTGCTTPCPNP